MGGELRGKRTVLVAARRLAAYPSRSPKGANNRAEIYLECGHVINRKLSQVGRERFRCEECSEAIRR